MEIENVEKTCLLITPLSFYSYSEYLKNALTLQGYTVTISNDEYPENAIGKIMGKLRIPILLNVTRKKFEQYFLKDKSYNLVLIIKGRGMSTKLINQLKQISPRVIGYTYDSFKYHSAPQTWLKHVNQFYTFDYVGSEKNDLKVIELFSSLPENNSLKICAYEISAIARNHSTRLKYIDEVLSNLDITKKFIYIFEQNIFTFIQNFIKNPMLYLKYRKFISFKPLSFEKYTKVIQESNFIIDFAHPSQSGITIRCFEALNASTKIITNNPFVSRFKYFNETNTIVFNEKSDVKNLKSHFTKIKNQKPEKYARTIHHFIKELISE